MPPASDNTAGGMSSAQEDSMYTTGGDGESHKDKVEGPPSPGPEPEDSEMAVDKKDVEERFEAQVQIPSTEAAQTTSNNEPPRAPSPEATQLPSPQLTEEASSPPLQQRTRFQSTDHTIDWTSKTKPWTFSRKLPSSAVPSSLFQPYSKYTGTQQSDRQIYKVAVTILSVDMDQCTLSGYLEICGLTPDHPELTTFFTGEIIGGPNQKYSFRTKNPAWGASNKTDLTHWARFPSWRPLSGHAKNDIEFVHPMSGGDWWQEEHIYMRWKEHFLVPDHKLKSIQGASFEGFYYICMNQIKGEISGVYFHSKSEKYQQLFLKHEGGFPAWGRGVRPAMDFR
ncbi:Glucose-induced degradation-like protein [Cyphellophora attinorum]|uniref:Glucose-induced degradation-like protein n=1 Tax=Cyphellophora attinorum TaxID=1664694 RepID=A0A0N1HC29_9EURO|nr:Glucose-induced degradation-like protein [Phialophora attinorum]KPI42120.1 Glucose-induced degradation-like protein [Phialophora attinorum]